MKYGLGALLMMITGCSAVPPGAENGEVPVNGGSSATCDAAAAQHLIGRAATEELAAEAMRLTGAAMMRWIPEGGMVTMDHRPDRLNIELDGSNKVKAIRCG